MGLQVGVHLEATRLDRIERIGRRRLNPVHLAAHQRGGTRVGLGQWQQHHLVDGRCALGVPVTGVLDHLKTLARHQACALEGAGTRWVGGKGGPGRLAALGLAAHRGRHRCQFLGPVGGRGHEQVAQVDRQKGIGLAGGQLHRQVIDLLGGLERGHARGSHPHLGRVKLFSLLVQHLVHVPDHGIGREGAAIVELDTGAQLEQPLGLVLGIHLPGQRQARHQLAGLVGLAQVPLGQRVIQRNAGKTVAFKTLVRLARGARDIARSHCNAQHFFLGHGGTSAQRQGDGQSQAFERGAGDGETGRRLHYRTFPRSGGMTSPKQAACHITHIANRYK